MTSCFDRVRTAIAGDLSRAMKARKRIEIDALRRSLNTLDNATASGAATALAGSATERPRRQVSVAQMRELLLSEAQECAAAAIEYDRLGRPDHAGTLRAEAQVIRGCLRHLDDAPSGAAS